MPLLNLQRSAQSGLSHENHIEATRLILTLPAHSEFQLSSCKLGFSFFAETFNLLQDVFFLHSPQYRFLVSMMDQIDTPMPAIARIEPMVIITAVI